MIATITGILSARMENSIIIETGGIGYEVFVPGNSRFFLDREGSEVTAYTALVVREDDLSLFGFEDRNTLKMFRLLVTVSGVGAKAAMSVLSTMPSEDVRRAIVFEDTQTLARSPGVGKKTAQRIVLDLKDKLAGEGFTETGTTGTGAQTMGTPHPRTEAMEALISLGYSRGDAGSALSTVTDNDLDTETYIKLALKKLY